MFVCISVKVKISLSLFIYIFLLYLLGSRQGDDVAGEEKGYVA
jgi:hypothetical protein